MPQHPVHRQTETAFGNAARNARVTSTGETFPVVPMVSVREEIANRSGLLHDLSFAEVVRSMKHPPFLGGSDAVAAGEDWPRVSLRPRVPTRSVGLRDCAESPHPRHLSPKRGEGSQSDLRAILAYWQSVRQARADASNGHCRKRRDLAKLPRFPSSGRCVIVVTFGVGFGVGFGKFDGVPLFGRDKLR